MATFFVMPCLSFMFTGFASGLPFFVIIQMIPIWLRDGGVSLAEIGLFSLVGMPYILKFLWSPLMDRYVPPFLGRRRGWLLLTQLLLLLTIGFMGVFSPAESLQQITVMALVLVLASASQDVVLDAYRRELLPDHELGLGNSIHVQAYRLAGLIPGSLSLVLADHLTWPLVFWITAAFMLLGLGMCLAVSEPESELPESHGLLGAVIDPFLEYWRRRGWKGVLLVLAFLFLYKLGDSMATALSSVFYRDLGFSKTEIGLVAKNAALWSGVIGGLLGGVIMIRLGINRSLWLFGVVQVVSILGFALLAWAGPVLWLLAVAISFEYLGVGLGTAAFVAFIARETSKTYAATQFALFSAITAVPRTVVNASTGFIVEAVGWVDFFLICTVVALPGMVLLWWVAPWNEDRAA